MDLGETVQIDDQIYNGKKKVQTKNKMFMDLNSIVECVKTLNIKNSEGYNRIPRRVLVDGIEVISGAFEGLFSRVYNQTAIPAQWQISKNIPIYK